VKAIPYSYTLDASSNVKSIVQNGAGVGKVA
jgi:pectate lyase